MCLFRQLLTVGYYPQWFLLLIEKDHGSFLNLLDEFNLSDNAIIALDPLLTVFWKESPVCNAMARVRRQSSVLNNTYKLIILIFNLFINFNLW
jgi:hypothetical protein